VFTAKVFGAEKLSIYTLNFNKCWVQVEQELLAVSDFSSNQTYSMNYVEFAGNYFSNQYPGENVEVLESAIDCSGYGHHIIFKIKRNEVNECFWLLRKKNNWVLSAKGKARDKDGVCEPEGAIVNPGDLFILSNPGSNWERSFFKGLRKLHSLFFKNELSSSVHLLIKVFT